MKGTPTYESWTRCASVKRSRNVWVDLAAEHEARTLYIEARNHCDQVGDYVSKNLFEELIADEEGHIDFLETQLALQAELGAAVYGQLQAKPTDDSK